MAVFRVCQREVFGSLEVAEDSFDRQCMAVIRLGLISRDGEHGVRDIWAGANCQVHQSTERFPHRKIGWLDVLGWGRVEVDARAHWEFAAAAVLHAESGENFVDVFGLGEHQLIRRSHDIDAEDVCERSEVVDLLEFMDQSLLDPATLVFAVRDDCEIIDVDQDDDKFIAVAMDEDAGVFDALSKILLGQEFDEAQEPLSASLLESI